MIKDLIIVGSGNQTKVISSIIRNEEINLIGFYVFENKKFNNLKNKKYKIFKKFSEINMIKYKNIYFIIGIGENHLREETVKLFNKNIKNIKWYTAISDKAIISKNVKIGKGTVIMPGCIINTNTVIGNHCIINTKSIIEHDNKFQNFSSTGPGIITGGNVKVGKKSFIGIASVIKNNIKIGYNTVVGAKSLILKNCKSNSKYYGSPAKEK